MSGHLSDDTVTTQNLDIVRIDEARQLLLVRGAVPGAASGFVTVRPAIKARAAKPVVTFIAAAPSGAATVGKAAVKKGA